MKQALLSFTFSSAVVAALFEPARNIHVGADVLAAALALVVVAALAGVAVLTRSREAARRTRAREGMTSLEREWLDGASRPGRGAGEAGGGGPCAA